MANDHVNRMKKITFVKYFAGLSYFYKRMRKVSHFQQEYFEKGVEIPAILLKYLQ